MSKKPSRRTEIIKLEELIAAGVSVKQVRELVAAGISIDEIRKSISEGRVMDYFQLVRLLQRDASQLLVTGCKSDEELDFVIDVRRIIIRGAFRRSRKLAEALARALFSFCQPERLKTTVTFTWPATHEDSYRYAKRKTSAKIMRDVIENRKQPEDLHVTIRLVLDTR